jgi:Uma2 family endonuclease
MSISKTETIAEIGEFDEELDDLYYFYYDSHPTEEDLVPESYPHSDLAGYLKAVLRWYYRAEKWFVGTNMNIYLSKDELEYPVSPDVLLAKVVIPEEELASLISWQVQRENRPVPDLVFEISSKDTWKPDLFEKPTTYAKMGLKEYFAYDPHKFSYWRDNRRKLKTRLKGWRVQNGQAIEIEPSEFGHLWSEVLNCWLVPDGAYLRLYDKNGDMCLTESEAKDHELNALLAKLRAKGIDPDTL